ncbi:Uncharacterised protein [Mycobacteroides abscessus subsp. abscessus]|nr:Uncharacterised protein [Mycobacteroides abscessus subsp. abscessus]
MVVREVVVGTIFDDARLRLDRDLLTLRRREPQGLREPLFASVRRCCAVDVGVVEEVDARVAGHPDELADLVVGAVLDTHHPQDDIGHGDISGAERDSFHHADGRRH